MLEIWAKWQSESLFAFFLWGASVKSTDTLTRVLQIPYTFCVWQKEVINALLCSTLTCCFLWEGRVQLGSAEPKTLYVHCCKLAYGFGGVGLFGFFLWVFFSFWNASGEFSSDEAWGQNSKNGWKDPFSSSWALEWLSTTFPFLHPMAIRTPLDIRPEQQGRHFGLL